jgi:hypothetical protein
MSAKGNKAKASKNAPKDPTPKSAPSAGRLPARSPIDDGMRSQMFILSPALQYRRRDSSPLVLGRQDPPRKKRKSKVSSDNTSASAADKSSSAEDTTISTSAVDKSSSAEDMPIKFPEKEHSASGGDKGPSSESGNSPLASRKSSRACPPWGDMDEPEDEEIKSSYPPKIAGEDSPPSALHAVSTLANNRTLVDIPVSKRHDFKMPSPSSSSVTTDEEDEKSPSLDHASSTEKRLGETIEGTTAYREFIRSGGAPESNEQWLAHLAKNLAGDKRRTKSPPGTPQSRELEEEKSSEEKAPAKPTLSVDPPARIPLELRLTEEELRLRKARKSLGRLTSLVSSVMSNTSLSNC